MSPTFKTVPLTTVTCVGATPPAALLVATVVTAAP